MKYKIVSLILICGFLTGCLGYYAKDGENIGQAKKLTHVTPLICPEYDALDISLGVMQNGVGSMSAQDEWFTVYDKSLLYNMRKAVEAGSIVRVHYDSVRMPICTEEQIATGFEIIR